MKDIKRINEIARNKKKDKSQTLMNNSKIVSKLLILIDYIHHELYFFMKVMYSSKEILPLPSVSILLKFH